ncbi:malto-oligosyltrehalose trehalohydrolase [Rhizobium paknamense]|uniref:Malto-oligosyltrehalose trehalohydrolase n=1 Tax=Rhizobium paknamense TaxID=1206817 RepID=A0ABU0IAK9_9HYPH|nr:malto-oligosyltrehalose trehalohydrolase [Rhizobium paknamense]MDQ0455262.1 malto-oligosyltrehalose trehalohydrolase [Rhizobium paknamense]
MTSPAFGPSLHDTGVDFRLWAPLKEEVLLQIEDRQPLPMQRGDDGWHRLRVEGVGAGTRYRFHIGDLAVPDPGSRFQPEDVHGPSEVIDTRFNWKTVDWQGRPWEETVIYELHLGTFTPEGTYRGAMGRLDHLASLGVTAIQLMPLSDFRGPWNWGYDGVLPYAPDSSYGRPEELAELIDAAHARGIQVFIDVVYNHLGPDGNYLPVYAPIFTEKHKSTWGEGINYDGEGSQAVREWAIGNALYWITDFRADGLRFDAVHAIEDDSKEHLLTEMARRLRAAAPDRHVHLIVENEENNPALLEREADGQPSLYTAQWNDDIHHVLHVASTGEDFGYYADFAEGLPQIGRALAEGFVYQGEVMPYRGSERGGASAHLPPTAFISFIQNHDQVGNRAWGDRIFEVASPQATAALAAVYLLAPQIPMIFMGEEWQASTPFPFFCQFDDELNEKVRQGRRKELARLPGFDEESAKSTPDPVADTTFYSAKLNWEERNLPEQAAALALYQTLIGLRHTEIVPRLKGIGGRAAQFSVEGGLLRVEWWLGDGSLLSLFANLSAEDVMVKERPQGDPLWSNEGVTEGRMGAWAVQWTLTPVASV